MRPRFLYFFLLLLVMSTSVSAITIQHGGKTLEIPVCGGVVGIECAKDEWCRYPSGHACGTGDFMGKCEKRPTACIQVYIPVCGCDNKSYSNECVAHSAGVDVAFLGECKEINPKVQTK